ncbi:MAG: LytTR family DNA-binding domain-containing protein [Ferruginibacter sp.]
MKTVNNHQQYNNCKLTVATCNGTYFFNADEILRLEASSNYTFIYFTNRKPLLMAKVLHDYEPLLCPAGFIRTHRSHLVNKRHVLFVNVSGDLIMSDDSRAQISRRKKDSVMKALSM